MDLKFKINKKERNLVQLLSALNCQFEIDLEHGELSIVGLDNKHIEDILQSVNNEFNIEKLDMNPTAQSIQPVIPEQQEVSNIIEIPDSNVQKYLDTFIQIIKRVLEQNTESGEDICKYIMSVNNEIIMKYDFNEPIDYNVGDIVICNFGNHLNGEVSGGYVAAIVCDIDDDNTFYAAPITKRKLADDINRYMQITENVDVDYFESKYTGGTVLLRKGRYIRKERIKRIAGCVRPEFFKKLLEALPQAMSFSYGDYEEKLKDELLDSENLSAEQYLEILLKRSLEKIDNSHPIGIEVEKFLKNIGFKWESLIIKKSFSVAFLVEKIIYKSIIKKVEEFFPNMTEKSIKTTMTDEFKKWLLNHPELKEKYPTISFMLLLKVFVKKYSS